MRKGVPGKIWIWMAIGLAVILPVMAGAQSAGPERIGRLVQGSKGDTSTITAWMKRGESFLDRPESLDSDMKMAFHIAGQMETLSNELKYPVGLGLSKLLLAKAYRESGRAAEGRKVSEEAVRLLSAYGTPALKAQAILELGGTYSNSTEDLPTKISLYRQGIGIYQSLGDSLSAAKLNEFVGELLQLNGQFTQSLEVLTAALAVYRQTGFPRLQGIYSLIGETHHELNNFAQSLQYNLLAVEAGEKLKDTGPLMSTVYNRVGLNYYSIKYYDQAIDYFNKALVLARSNRDTPTIKNMLINIADACRNKGMYRRSLDTLFVSAQYGLLANEKERMLEPMIYMKDYVALMEFDKADHHFRKLVSAYQRYQVPDRNSQLLRLAIVYYLQAVGRFTETIPYLRTYTHYNNSVPLALVRQVEGEYLLYRTDSAMGNLSSAISHFRQYKVLSDSLTSVAQAKQLAMLQLQFETRQKDKNIEFLTQKSELQEVLLQNEKVSRNAFAAGVAMLVLFSALMYNRYRLKKRSNLELEGKQKEINDQNEVLKKVVEEKEWLLKEVHHRVKNNLQIVISLLNTQSEYLDNVDAITAIRNSQHRMYAMSLIHQRLYQVDNLGKIDMKWYIGELIGYMKESFEKTDRISFTTETDPLLLDAVQAVPIGLIINEAVSNSIKYAFPADHRGNIRVSLKSAGEAGCLLLISDDGIGFSQEQDPQHTQSLGMSLMHGLSGQLDGSFNISSAAGRGVNIRLFFQCRTLGTITVKTSAG
ncbi:MULTISPECIES: histidine kinase dimerization/phosphoacceptor domain -containing protein [unclassified Chitinophaga]|uniref:histidine kinase dimerization/phosphoacceptor domain -containing protein n=1 Tax=unclassified Chitinophaga TaxID=2619133 RepID=UPI00301031A6